MVFTYAGRNPCNKITPLLRSPLLSYFGEPSITKQLQKSFQKEKIKVQLNGLVGSAFSIISASVIRKSGSPHLFIFNDKEEASYFINDIESLLNNEVFFYPASYRRAYQFEEADNSNVLLRSEVLNRLNNKRNPIIVTYPEALSEKIVSRRALKKQTLLLKNGQIQKFEILEECLIKMNFNLVDFVINPGEYSIRGGIIDIFSFAYESPFRIEFINDKIASIRTFDINSQLSIKTEKKITIVPNTEAKKSTSKKVSLLEYLPRSSIIWTKDVKHIIKILNSYFKKASENFKVLRTTKSDNPNQLFTNGKNFYKELKKYRVIENCSRPTFKSNTILKSHCTPILSFNKQFHILKEDLIEKKKKGYKNIILCSSKEQEERFHTILRNNKENSNYTCIQFSLHKGFIDNINKLAIYPDHEILNRHYRFIPKTKFSDKKAITIKQLIKLKIGDYVTHIDYGIGIFSGLHRINTNNKNQEVIKLTYKNNDILYVSIHSLHKISKYGAQEGGNPKINKLGSASWARSKEKTKKKVKEIAFDLIQLYAKRKELLGFSFSPDSYLQHELEASFIYEDTADQIAANKAIKKDMEQSIPMDRLVCGDVGFGKTEVAIRAAFKAITDNKQVAILVPTTILALQHYKTFERRLKGLPCRVDYINRFKTTAQQNISLNRLARGETDIIIGTHRIVSKDVCFKDLGLLIVDEEQKFGVNIKDKIKSLKSSIDTITLTATPIPRTLQFSLMGARDLSIINTPPPNRQSIETQIISLNLDIIRDAINYEMSRNGQVFFIHNRIENIKEICLLLERICPDAHIKIGHGRMKGDTIENLMSEFMQGEFDVLISTTIIENGVDIPNANTIIINNAQNFGLSDLHQMRGRVGRSNKKAFCYLISPPNHKISNDARKRLNALEQFSNLGSGFNIAMRDLDIRGAGNLLGADQSGFINEIGFEMYQKILNEAMVELKQEKFKTLFKNKKNEYSIECQIETDLEILIPEYYVKNIEERLSLYKELNNLKEEKEISLFKENLKDRFGPIPEVVFTLFDVLRLRWLAKHLDFKRIVLKNESMRIYLVNNSSNSFNFDSEVFSNIINYIKANHSTCEMKEKDKKFYIIFKNITGVKSAINVCKKFT